MDELVQINEIRYETLHKMYPYILSVTASLHYFQPCTSAFSFKHPVLVPDLAATKVNGKTQVEG